MRDPMRQRVGLARPGAGDDQERARGQELRITVFDRTALLGIEAIQIGGGHAASRGEACWPPAARESPVWKSSLAAIAASGDSSSVLERPMNEMPRRNGRPVAYGPPEALIPKLHGVFGARALRKPGAIENTVPLQKIVVVDAGGAMHPHIALIVNNNENCDQQQIPAVMIAR